MSDERDCYKAAIDLLASVQFDRRYREVVLCHGYPMLSRADGEHPAGTKYGHAWVEARIKIDGHVRDVDAHDVWVVLDRRRAPVVAELYYYYGRINCAETQRYTLAEALPHLYTQQHYGPWEHVPAGVTFHTGEAKC